MYVLLNNYLQFAKNEARNQIVAKFSLLTTFGNITNFLKGKFGCDLLD